MTEKENSLPPASRRAWLTRLAALGAPMLLGRRAFAAGRRSRILIVGDSLSAEYGILRGSGWVELLRQRLAEERIDAEVINASISGETTSGGRARLPVLLKQHRPTHVIIELGGNDALRGLPLDMTGRQLREMTRLATSAGARVLLLGMQLPPNYGRRYGEEFAALYAAAAQPGTALVPFFLKGVADVPEAETLFQSDRIHPRESAQAKMLDNVWPVLLPMLR